MDLIDDDTPSAGGNAPEFTVSEISGAVKRVLEGEFARVRVRGEVGRVSRPASGHLYFDLKDDRSVLAAVSWKGQVARMAVRPEEGMEVIATGRLTTFPGQSKYQLIVEDVEPAGAGALMAMLEKRRVALAAEGLFDAARKQRIPYLPEVIAVVTSPTGAVIRDILHRLRDRFPRRVLIWPVAVQGQACAPEVAAAIRGLNALPAGGLPRPDLIIVARGGGSLEDLWGFNEEIVVRAAAESRIPLISAVGHETDTTLIDFAADLRAPTPTAAAEMAVPVRMELIAWAGEQGARLARAVAQRGDARRQRLTDLGRGLGRPGALTLASRQRFDLWAERLGPALSGFAARKRNAFGPVAALVRPDLLRRFLRKERETLEARWPRLPLAFGARTMRQRQRLDDWSGRLAPAFGRNRADALRLIALNHARVKALHDRLAAAPRARLAALAERLARLDRVRVTLGYTETLRRGFALVWAGDDLVTSRGAAQHALALEVQFHDGRLPVQTLAPGTAAPEAAPPKPRRPRGEPGGQGSLF
ncbi:exodeoxyribonuclease VII large subunit [Phaeovulum sp.]|uniref:exodeoxyribonuclease VII large subunit n=1 Tax=Phaeovulum sp. TaxID=2934796 RepID=UPI00272F73F6|nr:exodeoxyribonuclease VII large subunit [Phaeovulum sp.]MDP1667554.1 exodeoxyribonuclease VII large subunit [Phaeovulum sp.]MDZ4120071.1 exodeoxyribonuclease VII large subunit [Phaeovulum sp.]